MNNRNFYIKVLTGPALSGLILTLLITCEKPERVVEFTTLEAQASNISYTTATLKGEITDAGSKPMEDHGILVSSNPNPRVGNATVKSLGSRTTKGIFSVNVTELTTNTTYYFRSYVTIEGVDTYTDKICNFKTKDYAPPTVTTGAATSVTATSATLEGTVNANDLSTTVTFEYGLTTSYGTEVTSEQSPVTGTTVTSVSIGITGLNAGTTYHYRVKAENAGGAVYGDDMTFTTPEQIIDADGNIYNTIQIGTQIWMRENLKTTKYNDASDIQLVSDGTNWSNLTTPGYCWYDNDEGTYKDTYGALYNWYTTVDVRNVCPAGWHVPSDAEWTILTDYLGGESIAGDKLKETGTTHWTSPNTGATNETGFTALPGGCRNHYGPFYYIEDYGYWWSSSEGPTIDPWYRYMHYSSSGITKTDGSKRYGFSVRCVKGESPLAQTEEASAVASTTTTLNGQVNPNGASTTVMFEYGLTTTYGTEVAADQSPVTGTTATSVSAGMTGLDAGTTYHYRVKAENSGGTTYGNDMTFNTSPEGTVADTDGNVYNTVTIGTQVWMKENLKATQYNDNTPIPYVTDNTQWAALTIPGFCYYNNDAATYKDTYGALYNWYTTVDVRSICPTGWHVPTDENWTILENYLIANGFNYDGTTTGNKIAKSLASTSGWEYSTYTGVVGNTDFAVKRNATDFTALPGGCRQYDGTFDYIGLYGYWWSAIDYDTPNAWYRFLLNYDRGIFRNYCDKRTGFSVRCIKD